MNSTHPSTPVKRHLVSITGHRRIDGRDQASARAVELLHLLAHDGPTLSREDIESALYGGYCSRPSLWYPLKVCREAGVGVHYDRANGTVVLEDELTFDLDIALDYLASGGLGAALWVLGGWPDGKGAGEYSERLGEQLKAAIASSPAGLCHSEVAGAFRTLDSCGVRDDHAA